MSDEKTRFDYGNAVTIRKEDLTDFFTTRTTEGGLRDIHDHLADILNGDLRHLDLRREVEEHMTVISQ